MMSLANPTKFYRMIHRMLQPVSALYRAMAFRKGRNATEEFAARSSLVLAPHPDDETLGCAATIMRKRHAGSSVKIIFATDGQMNPRSQVIGIDERVTLRRTEALRACAFLGVEEEDVEFLGFMDSALQSESGPLKDRISALITEHRPEDLFIPALGDRHADHYSLSLVVRELLFECDLDCAVYEYPIWYWGFYPWISRPDNMAGAIWHFVRDPIVALFRDAPLLVRTEGLLDRKREAIECYQSQIKNLTGEPEWWTFPDGFVDGFLEPHEIFFPVKHP